MSIAALATTWSRRLWRSTLWRFLVVGLANTVLGYGVYALLILLRLGRPTALLIATVFGVLFNFQTTGRIVFRRREWRRISRFVAVGAIVYGFNLGLLELLCRGLGLGSLVAQAISLPVVVTVSFKLNQRLVFA